MDEKADVTLTKVDVALTVHISEADTYKWRGPVGESQLTISLPLGLLPSIPLDEVVAGLVSDSIDKFKVALAAGPDEE